MKTARWGLLLVLLFLLAQGGVAQARWQLQGHQERGEGGKDGTLRCNGIKLEGTASVTRVECSPAGFWITDGQGDVRRYNDPQDAVGTAIGPGTYWVYPNLLPDRRTATVTLFLSPGGAPAPSSSLGGTSWKVGVLDGGRKLPPHSVPWVFHPNGTVEAPGLWTGTWTPGTDGIQVSIVHQGVSNIFIVRVNPDQKSFIATKNGQPYRHGTLVSSTGPAPPPVSKVSLSGDWALKADQFTAQLELRGSSGRIFYHAVGRWETIDQVSYDSSTGQVTFRRPEYKQVYRGRFVGPNRLEGRYVRRAGEGYDGVWEATRQ